MSFGPDVTAWPALALCWSQRIRELGPFGACGRDWISGKHGYAPEVARLQLRLAALCDLQNWPGDNSLRIRPSYLRRSTLLIAPDAAEQMLRPEGHSLVAGLIVRIGGETVLVVTR